MWTPWTLCMVRDMGISNSYPQAVGKHGDRLHPCNFTPANIVGVGRRAYVASMLVKDTNDAKFEWSLPPE